MKVAYFLHRFPYITETFVAQEMHSIKQQGVEIEIFSLLPPKHTVVHEQAKALLEHVHYSPWWSWSILRAQLHFLKRSPLRYFGALIKSLWRSYREPKVLLLALALFPKSVYFAQQIETLGIDHVHVHFVWLGALAAGIAKDLVGISYSVHPHAFDLFERDQRDVRVVLESAPQVTTISNYNRNYIASLSPQIRAEEIEIIHCGVDTDYFKPASRPKSDDSLRIVSVGQLVEKKGHAYLIDACAQLTQRGIRYQCQIVGAGPQYEALQARIAAHNLQGQVTLLGPLRQDQVLALYHESDIFALACVRAADGDQDGIPVALMEAMACELPVVSTPVAGIPELIHHEQSGLLVAEGDASALADTLAQLLDNQALRQQLGKTARQLVIEEFQSQRNVAKLVSILQRVSAQHKGSKPQNLTNRQQSANRQNFSKL